MMTAYTITTNAQFNSREVTFDGKPQVAILSALKALKMRWNPKRSLWYGFASESEITAAIQAAQPEEVPAMIYQDGYMGAIASNGAKSNRNLYGAELSAAIRADIKAAGIKGVTVKCESYSGGQNITATIKATAADLVPEDEFIGDYDFDDLNDWVYTSATDYMHRDKFYTLSPDEMVKVLKAAAKYEYENMSKPGFHSLNQYHIGTYTVAGAALLVKLQRVRDIINNLRYDDSNGQVDYFDTNFYYDMYVKIV